MNASFQMEDLFNVLIELETKGSENYEYLASKTDDQRMIGFFLNLAKQELRHKVIYEGYKKEFLVFEESEITPEYKEYMSVLLHNSISILNQKEVSKDSLIAYDMAITLEKDTILFLSEMKNIIPVSMHKKIDILMNEERQHLKFLYENKL